MKKYLSAIQWLVFHIGVVLSVPIIVGSGFELSSAGIENLMRLTFVITGAGSLLQNVVGHKNLLIEGPAGPWWAAYLVIIGVALPAGKPIELIRTDIQGALIFGGAVIFLAGLFGIIRRMQSIFTSRITGVFLLLIAVQISGIALERMVSQGITLFIISVVVLILSIALLTYSSGILKQSALLLSVTAGFTGGVGTTTFAISAGLVSVTQEKTKSAFVIGSMLFILIGIITPLGALLSTIPASIAGAILLISVSSIAVIGIQSLTKEELSGKRSFIVGLSLLIGTGIMFLSSEIWAEVPSWVASIFSNGVITGTLAAIFLEQVVFVGKEMKTPCSS